LEYALEWLYNDAADDISIFFRAVSTLKKFYCIAADGFDCHLRKNALTGKYWRGIL